LQIIGIKGVFESTLILKLFLCKVCGKNLIKQVKIKGWANWKRCESWYLYWFFVWVLYKKL